MKISVQNSQKVDMIFHVSHIHHSLTYVQITCHPTSQITAVAMYIAILFKILKKWKKLNIFHYTNNENMVRIYNRIALTCKENEIMKIEDKQMELKKLYYITQTLKDKHHILSLICGSLM